MKERLKSFFREATLQEMKEALFFLLSQIYDLLSEEDQKAFFLELFRGEEGKVPSMVYY